MKSCKATCKKRRREKRKKKTQEISVKSKSELRFIHTSSQHGGDIETNLTTLWNGVFSCRNQPHAPSKDDGEIDTRQYLLSPFNLLKNKTNPYNFTVHYFYNNKNTLRPKA